MYVEWPSACIICLSLDDLSREHVIPQSIRGKLEARLLCRGCNSIFGTRVEAQVRSDPTIRFLANELEPQIPMLAQRLLEGQPLVGHGPGGSHTGYVRDGVFNTQPQKLADGSILQPTTHAKRSLIKMLKKRKHGNISYEHLVSQLDYAPLNTLILIQSGIAVATWIVDRISLKLDGPILNSLAPAKMAYEFLALHLGQAICKRDTALEHIRQMFGSQQFDNRYIRVDRVQANKSKAFHGLIFEGNHPYAIV